jgi:hypothetical protein
MSFETKFPHRKYIEAEEVTVGDTDTVLLAEVCEGRFLYATLEVENAVGGQALSGFTVQIKDHPAGEFYTFLTGADFDSTVISNMLYASTTGPHELGADAKAHTHIRLNGAYAFRLLAKTASGTATVSLRGTISGV